MSLDHLRKGITHNLNFFIMFDSMVGTGFMMGLKQFAGKEEYNLDTLPAATKAAIARQVSEFIKQYGGQSGGPGGGIPPARP